MDGGIDGRFAITTSIPLIPIKSRSDDIADQLLHVMMNTYNSYIAGVSTEIKSQIMLGHKTKKPSDRW
jgi:hypothetical protein